MGFNLVFKGLSECNILFSMSCNSSLSSR